MSGRSLSKTEFRRPRAWTARGNPRALPGLAAALLPAAALVGLMIGRQGSIRGALVIAVVILLTGLAVSSPTYLLVGLAGWLATLGLSRRLLTGLDPAPSVGDPLLLIGPIAFVVLVVMAWERGAFRNRSALANSVIVFSAIALLGALNPMQGGVATGLSGLLFVLVPTAGFWVGRAHGRRAVTATLALVACLAIPAAVYGLDQTYGGFPSWDARWIQTSDYASLYVGGFVRPFSSFSASAEYAFFLACAAVVWLAFGLRRSRILLAAPILALLVAGIWLSGTRTVIVALLAAIVLMVAARRGWKLGAALLAVVAVAVSLPLIIGAIAPASSNSTRAAALAQHQLAGLSNPFNQEDSTLLVHAQLVRDGTLSALSTPFGRGTGSVTVAAAKFGGGTAHNTEGDPSNAAVALGLPGLIAFLAILVMGYRRTYGLAGASRDPLSVAALGIITVLTFQWLNGGQYAVAFLPWLAVGWADRQPRTISNRDPSPTRPVGRHDRAFPAPSRALSAEGCWPSGGRQGVGAAVQGPARARGPAAGEAGAPRIRGRRA
jgi:hypothetical protein